MLVWEPHLQKYMPFGNLKSYAKAEASEIGDFDPRPCCAYLRLNPSDSLGTAYLIS